jgi:hypothetical protein
MTTRFKSRGLTLWCSAALLWAMATGCSQQKPQGGVQLKKMAAGAQYAGFLSTYDNLKPNPNFESTVSFVKQDDVKNVRKYFAMIVDPVEVYVSSNADVSKLPDRGRTALTAYFQNAMTRAVSDAFPLVHEPGPLVLRMRLALVGVDVGAEQQGAEGDNALKHAIDIGKVGVEMEMVDSVTGEQIVAAVDRHNLGAGATVGTVAFTRDEKAAAAKEAFDGWATRLREFLDSVHELSPEDQKRASESYRPYGDAPAGK